MTNKEDIHRVENIIKDTRVENLNPDTLILQKLDDWKSIS